MISVSVLADGYETLLARDLSRGDPFPWIVTSRIVLLFIVSFEFDVLFLQWIFCRYTNAVSITFSLTYVMSAGRHQISVPLSIGNSCVEL